MVLADMPGDVSLRDDTTPFAINYTPRRVIIKEIFEFNGKG
jgi:hypothetical protein